MTILQIPQPGQIVFVRQRLHLVEQVEPPVSKGDSTLVRLSCVEDDAQGQQTEVLWECEVDGAIRNSEDWQSITSRGFDPPNLFAAYFNTLKWNCVSSTDPRLFQSPFRAGIRIEAYQLEPLRKALMLPRVNLFIADDVGLGKTIEAGLIARELLLRKKVRDIVVSCPPSMIYQWKDELEARFGLTFEVLDKEYVKRVRRDRGFGVNPWTTHSRFLVSHRLLIDEAYTSTLRDWLGDFRSGSLLILDEAHHAAPASGQKYAIDSHITRSVRDLAPRFEHRLFLSATPHNGHSNSFSALLEILDPQRFCRGVAIKPKLRDEVMVRRLKDDIREIAGGFAKRRVIQIDIDGLPEDAPELRLSSLLDTYRRLREQRLDAETKRNQAAAGLLITGLQQRLLSSVEAFARTLRVHRKTVERHWAAQEVGVAHTNLPLRQYEMLVEGVDGDDDRAVLTDIELQAEEDNVIEALTEIASPERNTAGSAVAFEQERQLINEMTEIAERSRAIPDARLRKLFDWMRMNMCSGIPKSGTILSGRPVWNNTRIIIFTEYEDTKRYLAQQLTRAIEGTNLSAQRIATFCGSTSNDEREEIKLAFNAEPATHPIRILIATDAAREGLNLQAHCWNLFHFDVPWNPSRMEQRNGRIDRKLQPNPEVYCHYFVHKQRPEDRILSALVRKTETIKKELGCLSDVIDARLAQTLKRGVKRDNLVALQREIESVDIDLDRQTVIQLELEATRERQQALQQQIDTLRTILADSQKNMGLDELQFKSTISSALQMMGAPPLHIAPVSAPTSGPQRISFPALDQRDGADPTWVETMDSLRVPRPRDQKLWEWRRNSPIRPVVFEDTGTIDDTVVHLHLEQRVVQRLLGRFSAQGFVYHDLSRACLAQSTDAIPRVVLLGRLSLYGANAARLHEELVPISARWIDADVRKTSLVPYAREAESRTMSLLGESLATVARQTVSRTTLARLQISAQRDVNELLPQLETRAHAYAADANKKLNGRGDKEARAMREILESQRKHIGETIAKHDRNPGQMPLPYDEAELRQLQANRRYWAERLSRLELELETEPNRVREQYDVKATRIEPVGLVYLWPVSG